MSSSESWIGYRLGATPKQDVFAYSSPFSQPWPSPHLGSLPFDILEELCAYFVPSDASIPPTPAELKALRCLSETCKRFRFIFQPKVFRYLVVKTERQVEGIYEVLNGSCGLVFKPMPEDADEVTRELYKIENAVPIVDVIPISAEREFLRRGVRTLAVKPKNVFDYLDIRFLLQMMPLLRHLIIADFERLYCQHILDKNARILRKWHNLESFYYTGGDLSVNTDRLPLPRAIANMTRLKHLLLMDLDIAMNPWIFTEDVGVGMDPTREDQRALGRVWEYVWYRPQLLMKEPPSTPWLPSRLKYLGLARINFEQEGVPLTEDVAKILRCERGETSQNLEHTNKDKIGEKWPLDFHPFARLVMCSRGSLRELTLREIKGVPHETVVHAMTAVGSRLHVLHVIKYPGRVEDIIACCPRLTYLDIDGYGKDPEAEAAFLDHCVPAHVRQLKIYAPWHFTLFAQWLECESSAINTGRLRLLNIITLVGIFEDGTERAILEAAERRNSAHPEMKAVKVVLDKRQEQVTDAGSDEGDEIYEEDDNGRDEEDDNDRDEEEEEEEEESDGDNESDQGIEMDEDNESDESDRAN
ncbi:hypothetical protein PUNSTDRAFT_138686 [Punctularia strigosozonata HHB-11173 SS5]|uniref:Uncharacterized protein n=1 Tax=Punctularia strigosozonata (strain HHB-11173) TaxID=741275 RepID=R7S4V0_PUNST|nr:uncharacterized protein PUNSTDRAFT_138686 [Punctularia strigosozonata HHB-11173 SS5]EIN04291.1 hypothetical protein PUNSTDRAFT_138686 [Punctularia strigosozonata HHB-11173 SS5]